MDWNFSIQDYVDVHLIRWLIWLFTPLLITFLFPVFIILLFYISAIIVYIYRHRHQLAIDQLLDDLEHRRYWDGAMHAIAIMWDAHGHIWYGYEIEGFENIPETGPALIVYYHGALPIDYYYLVSKCFLHKKRLLHSVVDRFFFHIPGWSLMVRVLKLFPGSVSSCVKLLNEGNLIAIAPGGVREAQFGNHNYNLIWAGRVGFAKVAKQANVPIIPVFTQNIREAFRTVQIFPNFFRKIYDSYKLPLMLIYGGFPVKLKTIVGKPIHFSSDCTVEEIAEMTANKLEEIIKANQTIPGSILRAMIQRFI
ncbi:DGAT1/2-independent enzyme synthesizing storage lipids [Dermatophagoides farinae]|uniref:Transmembrane protein 68 n=1 Tax=Dermatophagoides farinae TaxID=6954 RepID=A0A922I2L3_DERFA|nr:transmembrane protein 68-like [Dermatophagoides farinae]KAH7646442.1 transmembrane protein 68-like protein 1 [Dermatophagoides farinae]KAH9516901.1 Transmembrane protein 68 [Dermatophagoides farinae]